VRIAGENNSTNATTAADARNISASSLMMRSGTVCYNGLKDG
jgi:hypothetical protein